MMDLPRSQDMTVLIGGPYNVAVLVRGSRVTCGVWRMRSLVGTRVVRAGGWVVRGMGAVRSRVWLVGSSV